MNETDPIVTESSESTANLQSGCHHEVFLLQTQLFAFEEVVVGVQHARDVLSQVAIQNRLNVIAVVDCNDQNSANKWTIHWPKRQTLTKHCD